MAKPSATCLRPTRVKYLGKWFVHPGLSVLVLAIVVIMAIFAPWIAPHNPYQGDLYDQLKNPAWKAGGSTQNLLGTDYFGRDVLSRIVYGARVTVIVAFLAIILSALLGTVMGLIAAYRGGVLDAILMRLSDSLIAIPFLVVAVVLTAAVGASLLNVILVLAVFQWPFYARQIRAEALAIRETDYVALAKISGAPTYAILYRHFFLNVVPTLLVLSTFHIGDVIMWEAILSFLGLGVPSPMPSWGLMVSEGQAYIVSRWWLSAFPGIAILLTVLAANLLGDWVRDRLDPKLRQL